MTAAASITEPTWVSLTVAGRPKAKGRPKFHAKPTRRGKFSYTPERTRSAEEIMQGEMRAACMTPLEGPLALEIGFSFKRPQSWPKGEREAVDVDGSEPYYQGKPDLDNLVKLVKDAANGILWGDDAQVVRIVAYKVYATENETYVWVGPAWAGA